MPLTFAHPAAVIPLRRYLGRVAVPSALVIGSVMPDCPYFLLFSMPRAVSHSVGALFWYCVPVGLGVYLIFHLVLKLPLVSLMPAALADRLAAVVCTPRLIPQVPWLDVLLSLLIGAVTHLVWDAFTHGGGAAVRTFVVLKTELFSVGDYRVLVFKLLQHASTVFGMAAIVAWIRGWMRKTRPTGPCPLSLPHRTRVVCVVSILLASAVAATWAGLAELARHRASVSGLQDALGEGTITGITALGAAVIVFSAVWHLALRPSVTSTARARP